MIVPLSFMLGLAAAFNNPPGVDIWCGKAYRATYVIANRKSKGGETKLIDYAEMRPLNLRVGWSSQTGLPCRF